MERIEKAMVNDDYALGVFLDIQGAFDNVQPLPEPMIRWYSNYLHFRKVSLEYNGVQ